ncbi:MAG: ABC transporter permease [Alphaproteobacteria bacterium]
MSRVVRTIVTIAGLGLAWQAVVSLAGLPPYILPGPVRVAETLIARREVIVDDALVTAGEIVLGLIAGTLMGVASALALAALRPARRWLMPLLVVSQAVPVFALAPLLVLWFGYGIASKVVMAALVIYFPVTTAFFDGLRRTEPGWLDLARTMGATRMAALAHIRVPAALPALASGLRVAAAVAPIGAVIGEWVGSSAGLGYLMLQANARVQIDLLFAALLTLGVFAVLLYYAVDSALRRLIPWQAESHPAEGAWAEETAP